MTAPELNHPVEVTRASAADPRLRRDGDATDDHPTDDYRTSVDPSSASVTERVVIDPPHPLGPLVPPGRRDVQGHRPRPRDRIDPADPPRIPGALATVSSRGPSPCDRWGRLPEPAAPKQAPREGRPTKKESEK